MTVGSVGVVPKDGEECKPGPTTLQSRKERAARKNIVDRVGIGPVGALELDQRFQQELMKGWRRDLLARAEPDRLEETQMRQFYDFLASRGDAEVTEVAKRYLDDALYTLEAVDLSVMRALPSIEMAKDIQFTPLQVARLEAVLEQYVALSHKGRLSEDIGVMHRPTFCRFVVDCSLVAFEKERKGKPTYHFAVRLFDTVSRYGPAQPEAIGIRTCTVKQCGAMVAHLLGLTDVPANAAWAVFEVGLQRAERVIEALLSEMCKRNSAKQASRAQLDANPTEGQTLRLQKLFEDHAAPPLSFDGPLSIWTNGIKQWAHDLDTADSLETAVFLNESSYTLEYGVRDTLIEPGVIHVLLRFSGVFDRLFAAYCDEEQVVVSPARMSTEAAAAQRPCVVPHMTFAAFLRFCLDFSIFPSLCSFEKAWDIYRRAECVNHIKVHQELSKRRAVFKVAIVNQFLSLLAKPGIAIGDTLKECEPDAAASVPQASPMQARAASSPAARQVAQSLAARVAAGAKENATLRQSAAAALNAAAGPKEVPRSPAARSASGMTSLAAAKHSSPTARQAPRRPAHDSGGGAKNSAGGRPAGMAAQQAPRSSAARDGSGARGFAAATPPGPASRQAARSGASRGAGAASKGLARLKPPRAVASPDDSGDEEFQREDDGTRPPSSNPSSRTSTKTSRESRSPGRGCGAVAGPARIKLFTDLSWLRQPQNAMEPLQVKAYALLSALCDCCADRFQSVRGLLETTDHVDAEGFVDAKGALMVLDSLCVTHGIDGEEEMNEFIRLLDPQNSGRLDTFMLEKAAEYVRDNRRRRWPHIFDADSDEQEEAAPGSSGEELLGLEARRLSDKTPKSFCFGSAAFAECLVCIGIQHMYGAGVAVKTSMPGGMMALWLVAFLHSRFERLRGMRESAARDASDAGLVRPPFWKPPAVGLEPGGFSQCSTRANTRPSTRGSQGVEGGGGGGGVDGRLDELAAGFANAPAFLNRASLKSGELRAGRQPEPGAEASPMRMDARLSLKRAEYPLEPRPPTDEGRYSTFLDRLLGESPDLFDVALATEGPTTSGRTAAISSAGLTTHSRRHGWEDWPHAAELKQMAGLECETCGRVRDARGIGHMFCHGCSGVDDVPLAETALCKVFERRRLRREVKALRNLDIAR